MTRDEAKKRLGLKGPKTINDAEVTHLPTDNLEDSVDWRTKGAVNPVKNQL